VTPLLKKMIRLPYKVFRLYNNFHQLPALHVTKSLQPLTRVLNMPHHQTNLAGLLLALLFSAAIAFGAGGKINLNTATLEELDTLPGVGKFTAEKIVSMRPVTDLNALLSIKGMKPAEVEALRALVTLGGATPANGVQESPAITTMPAPQATPVPPMSDSLKSDIQLAERFLKDGKSPQPENWKPIIAQWEQDAKSMLGVVFTGGDEAKASSLRLALGLISVKKVTVEEGEWVFLWLRWRLGNLKGRYQRFLDEATAGFRGDGLRHSPCRRQPEGGLNPRGKRLFCLLRDEFVMVGSELGNEQKA